MVTSVSSYMWEASEQTEDWILSPACQPHLARFSEFKLWELGFSCMRFLPPELTYL